MIPDRNLNDHFRLRAGFDDELQILPLGPQALIEASFQKHGIIHNLYFKCPEEATRPLENDFVEVRIVAMCLIDTASSYCLNGCDSQLTITGDMVSI